VKEGLGGAAGEGIEGCAYVEVEADEVGEWITGESEGDGVLTLCDDEGFAGACGGAMDEDAVAGAFEEQSREIVMTDAGAAGDEEDVGFWMVCGWGVVKGVQGGSEVFGDVDLVWDNVPLVEESADEGGVGIADLAWLGGLGWGDDFVAGGEMEDAGMAGDEGLDVTDAGEE
jgi:hypothetical protein